MQKLVKALNAYKRIVEIKKELGAISVLSSDLGTDAMEKEAEDNGLAHVYDPKPYLVNAG